MCCRDWTVARSARLPNLLLPVGLLLADNSSGFVVRLLISGPLNIGSGAGCSVLDLASLILNLTRSASAIQLLPAKTFEVTRFVADNGAAKHLLNLAPISDPLVHLAELLETTKRQLSFHVSEGV